MSFCHSGQRRKADDLAFRFLNASSLSRGRPGISFASTGVCTSALGVLLFRFVFFNFLLSFCLKVVRAIVVYWIAAALSDVSSAMYSVESAEPEDYPLYARRRAFVFTFFFPVS